MLNSKLVQQINATFVIRIFFIGMAFVIRVILARMLGAEGLGAYNYAFAWVDVLLLFTVFGLNRLVVRELSVAAATDNWTMMKGLMRFTTIVPLIMSILLVSGGVLTLVFAHRVGIGIIPPTAITATAIALLYLPIQSLVLVRQGVMQALNHVSTSQLPEYVIHPLVFTTLVTLAWLLAGRNVSVEVAALIYVATGLMAFLYGETLVRQITPSEVRQATAQYQWRYWVLAATPMIFMNALLVINNRLDLLMLGSLADTTAVGIYATAVQITGGVTILLSAVNTALSPSFARLYKAGKHDQLYDLFTRTTRIVLVVAVLISLGLFVFGTPILALFGAEFTRGTTALNIMLIGQVFNAFTGSVGALLVMTDNSRYTATALAIGATLNVGVNIVLIPAYGVNGAAIATTISVIVINTALMIFVRKQLGFGLAIFRRGTS